MKITKLITKDNKEIVLGNFTVLVGPNNVGKSQTLGDIHNKMQNGLNTRTTIITKIEFLKPTQYEDLFDGLQVVDDLQHAENQREQGVSP